MKIFPQKILQYFFLALLLPAVFFADLHNSYAAADYGSGRLRTCTTTPENSVRTEDLDFNPTTGGKDVEFVLTNPVCLTVIATSYATVKGAIALMNGVCGTGSPIPRLTPSPWLDSIDIAKGIAKAPSNPACGAVAGTAVVTFGAAIAQLGIIYGIAQNTVYNKTSVCGSEWKALNPSKYDRSSDGIKGYVEQAIQTYISTNNTAALSLEPEANKNYRQWYYGGIEVEDNPAEGEVCYDVLKTPINGQYPRQRYYLKGLETGNYNCKKYKITGAWPPDSNGTYPTVEKMKEAYNCCIKRSKEFLCINYNFDNSNSGSNKVFCKAGSRCTINGITFSVKSIDNGRLLCGETYSLCPYNFTIGGGSEFCDYYRDGVWREDQKRWVIITPETIASGNCTANTSNYTGSEIRNANCTYNNKAGKCRNYCQYLAHCTKTSDPEFVYRSGLSSPYFSEACINFIGDSKNNTAYRGGILLGNQRHFSAPIAQCMRESLENIFFNKVGHSKCLSDNEYPTYNGTCLSGLYVTDGNFVFKKGNYVGQKSFFSMIQDYLQLIVKLVLTLSVVFTGMNILLGKFKLERKTVILYIFKIAIVLYFATGDAWQTTFFKGVYGASMEFSRMVFKISVSSIPEKRDGCQFGNISLEDGTEISSGATYPPGKEYLAIWDTLDCKIARYLGFGPEVSEANIAPLIISTILTGPIGIYFALSLMFFGILLVAATIRALHIFVASALSIIIFVFISPIIFPTLLFEKTKNIFDAWLKELIGFCLQPMILFAYIAIFISVLDKTMIGSATYIGNPPERTISCAQTCISNVNGSLVQPAAGASVATNCDAAHQRTLIDPLNDSIACLIRVNDFGRFPGLEIIGVSLPIVINLFTGDVQQKILTMLKAALVMYLLYKFMDEIPGIATRLVGSDLPSSKASGGAMFMKMMGVAGEVGKRVGGASRKLGRKGYKGAKNRINQVANRGKNTEDTPRGGAVRDGGGGELDNVGNGRDDGPNDGGDRGGANLDNVGRDE